MFLTVSVCLSFLDFSSWAQSSLEILSSQETEPRITYLEIQSSLQKRDIAIEFDTYSNKDTTFYVARTIRPGYAEPHLVELFNSMDLKRIKPGRYYTSPEMTVLVWGNLTRELEGVRNVYFSPAGELNNIGIEYLLDIDGKHIVSEKRNYYRLTSMMEVVKEHTKKKIGSVVLYGGLQYGNPQSNVSFRWWHLPGTKEEVEAISAILLSKKIRYELFDGEIGTEESFKAMNGAKKDVIHISTHSFYWTESEMARIGLGTPSFMQDSINDAPQEDQVLSRAGLLFAGAQKAFNGEVIPTGAEDGVLTAMEISKMDLSGTDLVVISANNSGLGLQQGFKKAGVQSIVMSLWEVDDTATKVMMTRFYENLAKGKSKYDAFREAQNYLRKYDKGRYDEPEYYAAFVLLDAIR